jgi:tRNA pseudouridine55 synthase
MNGVLVVDKPAGPTSHDVVARARRATGISRIGHTGTLDPLATGVLALVVGQATRLTQFLTLDEKEYVAGVRFGSATGTYDAEERTVRDPASGRVALVEPPRPPANLDHARIEAALLDYTGTYMQTPPPYSAKKIGGVAAHRLARRNAPVEIPATEVTVRSLTLERYEEGLGQVRVVCSAGFYVRSLAHGLGETLGCGAHLETLRRTRVGDFDLGQATPLEEIERLGTAWVSRLVPMRSLLPSMPSLVATEEGARRAAHGNELGPEHLSAPASAGAGRVRLFDREGTLLGIAAPMAGGILRPVVVLV